MAVLPMGHCVEAVIGGLIIGAGGILGTVKATVLVAAAIGTAVVSALILAGWGVNKFASTRAAARREARRLQASAGVDYAAFTPDVGVADLQDPILMPVDSTARRIGRVVGATVRREMGYPEYTVANRTVAIQRIEAYRREHLTTLRSRHAEMFVQHAMYWVFQSTHGERALFDQLHNMAAVEDRRVARGSYDYLASNWFWWLPKPIQRGLKIAPLVGPGFQ